jgi:hypothetical protein
MLRKDVYRFRWVLLRIQYYKNYNKKITDYPHHRWWLIVSYKLKFPFLWTALPISNCWCSCIRLQKLRTLYRKPSHSRQISSKIKYKKWTILSFIRTIKWSKTTVKASSPKSSTPNWSAYASWSVRWICEILSRTSIVNQITKYV